VSNIDLLEGLNERQKEAVLLTEGPLLVIAGAGSGKTKVLTHRLAHLILDKNISPYSILAVTFTNKAAGEMGQRMHSLLISNSKYQIPNPKKNQNSEHTADFMNFQLASSASADKALYELSTKLPWLGTFHSICVRILRKEIQNIGYERNFVIYDSDDSLSCIKKIIRELKWDPKEINPNSVRNMISSAKSEFIDPNTYAKYADGYFQEKVTEIYKRYQDFLRRSNALDFDDLLNQTLVLFEEKPEILFKYQDLFKYILIDEYQDTNQAQYLLAKKLSDKHKNICVVGDDYQAIYSWRGANFKNILNFERDYPKAKVVKLEQNYRNSQNIIQASENVIKKNTLRTDKNMWTKNEEGAPITIYKAADESDEADFIVGEIVTLKKAGESLNSMAILYRTNAQSRSLEEAFLNYGIPYRVIGSLKFYERREIKDIISYLRLIVNPSDFIAFERAVSVPPRGIGDKTIEQLVKIPNYKSQITNKSQILNLNIQKKMQDFLIMIEDLRNMAAENLPADFIDILTARTNYRSYLVDGTIEGEARWENVEELKTVAQNFDSLESFLENIALMTDLDEYDEAKESVTLMTMHCAKGLEFETVFIAGMEEGLFPHSRSISEPNEMEEERRLCYVGMTRAKMRLYMIYAGSRTVFGRTQMGIKSRFLNEIPEWLCEEI